MKKFLYIAGLIGIVTCFTVPLYAEGGACKAECRVDEGVICLERGPCEPENEFLLNAAKECREDKTAKYTPVTKLLFVDILSQIIRLDRELSGKLDTLTNEERYIMEAKLLEYKGIDTFAGKDPLSSLTREELAEVLEGVTMEQEIGLSSGLPNQMFDLNNEKFVVYDVEIYVDEGRGFELWERKSNLENSSADSRYYMAKLSSCGDAMMAFGDGEKGNIPKTGSRIKAEYKFFGRNDEIVTKCEIAMLLSNPDVARSLKDRYNPSRPLTKANFADLLIKTMQLSRSFPRDYSKLSEDEIYAIQTKVLLKSGINIFMGSDPEELLTREELAKVLYDLPVEEVVGVSNGQPRQSFDLNNAGFMIYDMHVYVNEGQAYEEWQKKGSFMESSFSSKDYFVKLDSGNYADIYFGDNRKGKIPTANSPVKVKYRLYAPVNMFTEDDIICVLSKLKPIAEAYEPPPSPPFDFPDPPDGFDDPASNI
ncbi:MAG: hypothetical protein KKH08_04040 [Candidatus Omnitrophica bacterium]|nr:hypothetical protein [Candidatus Omnitrophota bacterium]